MKRVFYGVREDSQKWSVLLLTLCSPYPNPADANKKSYKH